MPSSIPVYDHIRQTISRMQFRKELAHLKRLRRYINLEETENIGILFDASLEKNYTVAYDFARLLIDQQKKVKALGFVNSKAIPHYCHPRLSFDYFTLKDINWYHKPVSHFVQDFIAMEFDMTISLDLNNIQYITYVMALSRSHFKVGKYHEKNKAYLDLMIDLQDSGDTEVLLKDIMHYLTILKSPPADKARVTHSEVTDSFLFS